MSFTGSLVVKQERDRRLHLAAKQGDVQKLWRLLRLGAPVDARDPQTGCTALMWAAASGQAPAARLLLAAGASPGAVASPPGVADHRGASARARAPLLTATLAARAGDTPLHLVARHWQAGERAGEGGHFCVARALLAAGADPRARNGASESALSLATLAHGAEELVVLLRQATTAGVLPPPKPSGEKAASSAPAPKPEVAAPGTPEPQSLRPLQRTSAVQLHVEPISESEPLPPPRPPGTLRRALSDRLRLQHADLAGFVAEGRARLAEFQGALEALARAVPLGKLRRGAGVASQQHAGGEERERLLGQAAWVPPV